MKISKFIKNLKRNSFILDISNKKLKLIDILEKINSNNLGFLILKEGSKKFKIVTDGDIRRGVEQNGNNIFDKTAKDFMSANPKVISSDTLAITALELMEKYNITSLFVYSSENLKSLMA